MKKFAFTIERIYTWTEEIEAGTQEEAREILDKMFETTEFDEDRAQCTANA